MRLRLQTASLRATTPVQYAQRFLFGGLVTVVATLIADKCGPVVGGMFLAFPGIFPAGVSLVEKHKTERESQEGKVGVILARGEASVEAAGASAGTLGAGRVCARGLEGVGASLAAGDVGVCGISMGGAVVGRVGGEGSALAVDNAQATPRILKSPILDTVGKKAESSAARENLAKGSTAIEKPDVVFTNGVGFDSDKINESMRGNAAFGSATRSVSERSYR